MNIIQDMSSLKYVTKVPCQQDITRLTRDSNYKLISRNISKYPLITLGNPSLIFLIAKIRFKFFVHQYVYHIFNIFEEHRRAARSGNTKMEIWQ